MSERRYWQAINDALREEMRIDNRILILGEDVAGAAGRQAVGLVDAWGGPFGITRGLIQEFGPDRVRDTPISEAAFVGAAVGLALEGYRPWVDVMFTELLAVAWDQITNRIARTTYLSAGQATLPITIKTFGECYSPICHYPGLIAVAPSDAYTAKGLTVAALRNPNPVVVFDSLKLLRQSMDVPDDNYELPFGRSRVLRAGTDITLLGIGATTLLCVEAAQRLEPEGISTEVVDLLTLSPWDVDGIAASVAGTGRLAVVDFDHPTCGLAHEICGVIASKEWDRLKAPPIRVGPVALPAMIMDANPAMAAMYYPSPETVSAAVTNLVVTHRPVGSR